MASFYSAISLQICGDNSLVKDLRFLTCWELYHNASYYANHPIINRAFETNTIFKTKSEIFSTFISHATFETFDKNHLEMSVTQEFKNSLVYGTWSPFPSVFALASVIQCNIESIYPNCGEEKYKLIFNQIISPRHAVSVKSNYVTILRSTLSVLTINREKFKPEHIAPLVFIDDNAKSINESKKRESSEPKLNSSKQSKISFPRFSESGPLKIESTLVIPATPSLLDSGGYTQSKTSNTRY